MELGPLPRKERFGRPTTLPAIWGLAALLVAIVLVVTRCGYGAVLIAADGFDSVLRNGWGSTDAGGSYTLIGDPSDFDVADGVGTILLRDPSTLRAAYLSDVSSRDFGATLRVTTDRAPVGGRHFIYLCLRRTHQAEYVAKMSIGEGGAVFLQASSLVRSGTEQEVALGPEIQLTHIAYEPGIWMNLEAQISGVDATRIRIRAWPSGSPQPGWQVSVVDALPALQVPGTVGIRARVGTAVTELPLVVRVDDFRVGQ